MGPYILQGVYWGYSWFAKSEIIKYVEYVKTMPSIGTWWCKQDIDKGIDSGNSNDINVYKN